MSRDRVLRFPSLRAKAQWIDGAASVDALTVPVRVLASRFVRRYPSPELRARAMHRWVRDTIRYVQDRPAAGALAYGEQFASSPEILRTGQDDCDGKARLLVAIARAGGIEARIRAVFPRPDRFTHVQAELRWPGSAAWERASDDGWVLAETILRDCELGDDPDAVPRDAQGQRVLAGPK